MKAIIHPRAMYYELDNEAKKAIRAGAGLTTNLFTAYTDSCSICVLIDYIKCNGESIFGNSFAKASKNKDFDFLVQAIAESVAYEL